MTAIIHKVKDSNGWMGNMSPYPLEYEGQTWRTAEALFQALRHKNTDVKDVIRSQTSPMAAKLVAKRYDPDVEPLSSNDVDNMEMVLRLKLEQHPELIQLLIDTGDELIVEDCTKRQRGSGLFWGAALKDGKWEGTNTLGKLWMRLRDEDH